jgi:membrane associated rhomboid family serine protease
MALTAGASVLAGSTQLGALMGLGESPHASMQLLRASPLAWGLALLSCTLLTTPSYRHHPPNPSPLAVSAADSRDQVAKAGQAWRLASSLAPAPSVAAGLAAGFLLYRFRTFERQMGSGRFSLLLLLATAWAVATRAAWVYGGLAPTGVSSGPIELLFALFVYFYREWPLLQQPRRMRAPYRLAGAGLI